MKNASIGKPLPSHPLMGTDLAQLRTLEAGTIVADEDTPYDPNNVEAVETFWRGAMVRYPGQRGKQKTPVKVPTTIRLDVDVLAALKATGPGWQTRMNLAMREWLDKQGKLSAVS